MYFRLHTCAFSGGQGAIVTLNGTLVKVNVEQTEAIWFFYVNKLTSRVFLVKLYPWNSRMDIGDPVIQITSIILKENLSWDLEEKISRNLLW